MPYSKQNTTHDRIGQLLAGATAGLVMDPTRSTGPKGNSRAMDVLAALGMAKVNHWGGMLLLASYQHDEQAWQYCLDRSTRFVWLSWLQTAGANQGISPRQASNLATMTLQHHCNPELARKTGMKKRAQLVGVGHQKYAHSFKSQYQRLSAELQYQENQAAARLLKSYA